LISRHFERPSLFAHGSNRVIQVVIFVIVLENQESQAIAVVLIADTTKVACFDFRQRSYDFGASEDELREFGRFRLSAFVLSRV
jgi:hypothetical protein